MGIMCKHDVMNIQHARCGLVGPDCKNSPERPLPATGILKAAYVSASLAQPGGDVEHPISLCANMMSSTKREINNISLRHQRRTMPWPQVTCTKKLVKIRRVVPEIWSQTNTHTDRQTNMLITMLLLGFFWSIFAPPLLGWSKKCKHTH